MRQEKKAFATILLGFVCYAIMLFWGVKACQGADFQDHLRATVFIYNDAARRSGSGVIASPTTVITAYHVLNGVGEVPVLTKDGRIHRGKVMAINPKHDLAVLKIEGSTLNASTDILNDLPKQGDMLTCTGNPSTTRFAVDWGRVMTGVYPFDIQQGDGFVVRDLYLVSIGMVGGFSGGGCWNEDGYLVGIISAIIGPNAGVVPTSELCGKLFKCKGEPKDEVRKSSD